MRFYVPLTGYRMSKEKQKASHQGFEKQSITYQIFINYSAYKLSLLQSMGTRFLLYPTKQYGNKNNH